MHVIFSDSCVLWMFSWCLLTKTTYQPVWSGEINCCTKVCVFISRVHPWTEQVAFDAQRNVLGVVQFQKFVVHKKKNTKEAA